MAQVEGHERQRRERGAAMLGGRGAETVDQRVEPRRRPGPGQRAGLAVVYCMQRKQFGQSIANFQMVQGMLADMSAKVEAARQLVYAAARACDAGAANVTKMAAQAKLFATDVAMDVTTDAVQLFGGYGYMRDYPIEKYMRDAKITQIYEGTNQIQRMVVARNLMKEAGRLDYLEAFIPLPDHPNTIRDQERAQAE